MARGHAHRAPSYGAGGAQEVDHDAWQSEDPPRRGLGLSELEVDASRPGVVAPGAFELRIAGPVQPLPEEPVERLLRRLLHDTLEIPGESRRVAIASVVVADPAEKHRVTHEPP